MRHAVFVVPFRFETSLRFLKAAFHVPGVAVSLISQDPVDSFGPDVKKRLTGHWQVKNALDARHLATACVGLSKQHGPVDRLIGVLEQLQEPLAEARAELGLPGLSVDASHNFRDKSRMKDVLRAAGVPCARHRLATNADEARRFLDEIGYPVVMKPPAGAGAVNTFRLDEASQLEQALSSFPPGPGNPALIEEFIVGKEHSFDSVMVKGEPRWHSISVYSPTPLEVLKTDWIQWCVLLPREIDGPEFDEIRRVAAPALRALGLETGLSHMEWFRRPDGTVAVSEVGARPPGAQFTSLMSYAHDADMYLAWSRLMMTDEFDPPTRRYAAGAAYLKGQGRGKIKRISGLDEAQKELGRLAVEVKLPEPGKAPSTSYEGDGYAILRHPETAVVAEGLKRLVSMVRVELG